ncbi:MAG: hypothetical protein WBW75_15600 [Mycobacterium sp.]|uniref:hypothetical protein n=1 Tax=Mycobacterium sp. TaxID=1785 RepID=UPI003C4AB7F5
MKHVTFLTYPLLVTGLTALSVGGCSSNATNTSQSSAQASGSSGTPAAAPKVTATITVGKSPDSVAVDSGAKIVYVTNSGQHGVGDRRRVQRREDFHQGRKEAGGYSD